MPILQLYHVYAICFVAVFLLILVSSALPCQRFKTWLAFTRNFALRVLIKRHALIGPWSVSNVMLHLLYIAVNLVCVCVTWQQKGSEMRLETVSSADEAASQAGYLAIVNCVPLFITPSLSATADLLSFSIRSFTRVHRAAGMMSACLCIFHAAIKFAATPSLNLSSPSDVSKVIVIISIPMVFIALPVKKLSYEVFLWVHQIFAGALVFGASWHVLSVSHVGRLPLFLFCMLMGMLNLFIFLRMIYRNKTLGSSWPRAFLARVSNLDGVVHMRLRTSRLLKIEPGQYMNIWIPRAQFWSMHPFAVASSSWHSATGQMHLDFFVQSRKGLTRRLFQNCHESATVERFVLFSGPHGTPIKHTSANTVIMIATGMGIWPMLSYIEDMVHTNRSQSSTSRIVLVYITKNLSTVVRDAVNLQLLKRDERMRIFICDESEQKPYQLGRATTLPHVPDLQQLIERPVDFENEVRFQNLEQSCVMNDDEQSEHGGRTLLIVSAENEIRDEIVQIVSKSRKRLELYELDYIPISEPVSTEIPLHGTSEIKITRRSVDSGKLSGSKDEETS